jgi:hypothetical protein
MHKKLRFTSDNEAPSERPNTQDLSCDLGEKE